MSLDLAPVGVLTTQLLDRLELEYGGDPDVQLRACMVLVDIEAPDPDGDDGTWTHVRWHFGERATHYDNERASSAYAAGLVAEAYAGLTGGETR